jgi:hypothetical protein
MPLARLIPVLALLSAFLFSAGCSPEGAGTVTVPQEAKRKLKGMDADKGDETVKSKGRAAAGR